MKKNHTIKQRPRIEKCPTGIRGLDEITEGGLPRGRPTLVCGGAGCGKTLLAMEFIVRGARDMGEPGVFMAFEETEDELTANVASLGFDLPSLIRRKKFAMKRATAKRDRAIILTLLDTGLRASEICALTIGDLDSKTGRAEVKHGTAGAAKVQGRQAAGASPFPAAGYAVRT